MDRSIRPSLRRLALPFAPAVKGGEPVTSIPPWVHTAGAVLGEAPAELRSPGPVSQRNRRAPTLVVGPHIEEFEILALRAVFVLLAVVAVAVGFLLPTPGAGPHPVNQTAQIATLDLD